MCKPWPQAQQTMTSPTPEQKTTRQAPYSFEMRVLAWALALTAGFAGVEWAGGIFSGSLALVADAGHMLTDSSALAIALFALWLAARPAKGRYSYGLKRVEVLAAAINGLTLAGLGGWILYEAWDRAGQPRTIHSLVMIVIAVIGLLVNLLALKLLHGKEGSAGHERHHDQDAAQSGTSKRSLSLRSAWAHMLGDILGSVGAIGAGIAIELTGKVQIDLWVSGFIALLIFFGAGRILLESFNLLLDAYPKDINNQEVKEFFRQYPGVVDICDLHVWSVGSKEPILTVHLVVETIQKEGFLPPLRQALAERFHITHCTIQLEEKACHIGC